MFRCFFFKIFIQCFCFLFVLHPGKSIAQTCTGSLGDPIVNITFGAGDNFGPALPPGTTTSLQYQPTMCTLSGSYSILNYTSGCWPDDVVWHTTSDHTGDAKGYFMLIDASIEPSNFYTQIVDNLCSGTTYEFATWILNMCVRSGTLPNITFTIEKTDGTILGTYNTGDVPIINPATWKKYGMFFTTPVGTTSIVLKMRNNAPGVTGNDLALDDITFRPAGPAIVNLVNGTATNNVLTCAEKKETFEFTSKVDNCYVNTTFQWQLSTNNGVNWSNVAGANNKDFTRLPTVAGKYLYRLKVAEAGNINNATCSVSSSIITINVINGPQITAANNGANCTGTHLILNATGGSTYNWTGPNGFTATGNNVSINNVLIANAGSYLVMGKDTFGCTNTAVTDVVIYQTPVVKFQINAPFCENNIINFIDKSNAFDRTLQKWNWNFGDGATSSIPVTNHTYSASGNYPVSLSVTNDKGCISPAFIQQISVAPLPKANFILPAVCLTDPFATFNNSSTISDNSQTQFSYLWNFGDVRATSLNPNSSGLASPQHSYVSVGKYLVKLLLTSNNGCTDSITKNFTVNGAQPKSNFTIVGGNSFCSNAEITIADQSTVDFGSISKVEIYWDAANYPSVKYTDLSPAFSKKYTHKYPEFGLPATKKIQIRYIVYSGINCVNESIQSFELKGSPTLQFKPINSICSGAEAVTITEANELTGINGSGIYSGEGISATGLFNPLFVTPGTHVIRYTFTSTDNCSAFAEQNIIVFPQPTVNAGGDRTMISGGNIKLQASATGNILKYLWLPDVAINNNQILNPKVAPLQDIIYTLKVTSVDGCVANNSAKVFVLKNILIPSAFSPNGDGINDTWHIPYLESYPGAFIQVYNRFGEMVYHSDAKFNNWDGTFKGKKLPLASYAWMLHTGVSNKILYGMVTILH